MDRRRSGEFNWPRFLLQWGSLLFFVLLLFFPASGLLPELSPETYVLITAGLMLCCVLLSNFFCGYLCPAGTIQDLFVKLRNRLGIRPALLIPGTLADRLMRMLKYGVLLALIWVLYAYGTYALTHPARGIVIGVGIAFAVLALLGGLLVDRFWCKYFCPLGAVSTLLRLWVPTLVLGGAFALVSRIPGVQIPWIWGAVILCLEGAVCEWLGAKTQLHLLRIVRDPDTCNHCESCVRVCPMTIDLREVRNCGDIGCTLCAECVYACPKRALGIAPISTRRNSRGFGRFIPPLLTVLIIALACFFGRRTDMPEVLSIEGSAQADSTPAQGETAAFHPFAREFSLRVVEDDQPVLRLRRDYYREIEPYVCEFVDPDFENLNVDAVLPQLCAYMEAQEGALGVFARRTADGRPAIDILYCQPLNRDRLWALLSAKTWSYTDSQGVSVAMPAALHFKRPGRGYSYRNHRSEFDF